MSQPTEPTLPHTDLPGRQDGTRMSATAPTARDEPTTMRPRRRLHTPGASTTGAPVMEPADQVTAARGGSGGPPRQPGGQLVGPLVAVLRRPFLVLLVLLLVLLPAVSLVLLSPAKYTASSQILVGRVDVESTAVPGFVAANQQLAGVYSRLVETELVAARVSEQLGLSPQQVLTRVSASPVPESSILVIRATSTGQEQAVLLARTTAEQLVAYVQQTSVSPAGGDATLAEFRAASQRLVAARLARDTLQRRLDAAQRDERTAPAALQQQFVDAQAAVDAAQLEVNTLSGSFQNDLRGSGERNSLQVITSGVPQGSDRSSRLQLAVGLSVLLGPTLGVGLALLAENRRALRVLRRRVVDGTATA